MADPILARQKFFDKQVHMKAWRDAMAGENESRIMEILRGMGYIEGKDYQRQYPIGERFVIDFAFVNEQIAIEVDGTNHDSRKQRAIDEARDKFLARNMWVPIRIREEDLYGDKGRFYKNLINELVAERRAQWEIGVLRPFEVPKYIAEDYE